MHEGVIAKMHEWKIEKLQNGKLLLQALLFEVVCLVPFLNLFLLER